MLISESTAMAGSPKGMSLQYQNGETEQRSFRLFSMLLPDFFSHMEPERHLKGLPLEPENKQAHCPEGNSPFLIRQK